MCLYDPNKLAEIEWFTHMVVTTCTIALSRSSFIAWAVSNVRVFMA